MNANLSLAALALAPMLPSAPTGGENLPFGEEEEMKDLLTYDNDWIDVGGES
jgi:hypothetical protein